MGFETLPPIKVARWMDWRLGGDTNEYLAFGVASDEADLSKVRVATMNGTFGYTHDPADDTPNRTEIQIDTVAAVLRWYPTNKIFLWVSLKWFCRHRDVTGTHTLPLEFRLFHKTTDPTKPVFLTAVALEHIVFNCSCGNDPSRALYAPGGVQLGYATSDFFNLVDFGKLVLPEVIHGDHGPVCA